MILYYLLYNPRHWSVLFIICIPAMLLHMIRYVFSLFNIYLLLTSVSLSMSLCHVCRPRCGAHKKRACQCAHLAHTSTQYKQQNIVHKNMLTMSK